MKWGSVPGADGMDSGRTSPLSVPVKLKKISEHSLHWQHIHQAKKNNLLQWSIWGTFLPYRRQKHMSRNWGGKERVVHFDWSLCEWRWCWKWKIEGLDATLGNGSYLEDKKNHQKNYIREVICFINITGWTPGRKRTGVKSKLKYREMSQTVKAHRQSVKVWQWK